MTIADILPLNKIIQMLREWTACDIWAMISFGLISKEVWRMKKEYENQTGWRKIRENQIASEVSQTDAMKHMTDEIVGLKMLVTKYLIKE